MLDAGHRYGEAITVLHESFLDALCNNDSRLQEDH
jgi:hypothetical protein